MLPVDGFGESVAIVGYGAEGSSLLKLISKHSPDTRISVFDENPGNNVAEDLSQYANVVLASGNECLKDIDEFGTIYKSPGVSLYKPEIQNAIAKGANVSSAMQLWDDCEKRGLKIFITGTKGKSTTASLAYHVLRALGREVELGGNIGKPMTDLIGVAPAPEFWLIEASSYQLANLNAEPDIGIVLNLFPEHLDWHGSVDQYYEDKIRLFRDAENCLPIINAKNKEVCKRFSDRSATLFNDPEHFHFSHGSFFFGKQKLFSNDGFSLVGAHNMENVCAVLTLLKQIGISPAEARDAVAEFSGLPHRLEYVACVNGIKFVNDSISTIPQAAMAAVEAYLPGHVTLIVGGFDRGLDWQAFAKWLIASGVKSVIGLPGTGHEIIEHAEASGEQRQADLFNAGDLEEAVALAKQNTPKGGVVLLSPAAPSYNSFNSYKDRGDEFKVQVLG